jgi:hypothetical protein
MKAAGYVSIGHASNSIGMLDHKARKAAIEHTGAFEDFENWISAWSLALDPDQTVALAMRGIVRQSGVGANPSRCRRLG